MKKTKLVITSILLLLISIPCFCSNKNLKELLNKDESYGFSYGYDERIKPNINEKIYIFDNAKKLNQKDVLIILLVIFSPIILISCITIIINVKSRKKEIIVKDKQQKTNEALQNFLRYLNLKDYNAAIICLKNNNLYSGYFNNEKVAYCYCMVGKYQEAIDIYNRLLQTKPNDNEVKFNLALAKYKLNSADSKYLEELYNKEKPFVILKEDMKIMFNDEEQKEALKAEKIHDRKENIFGTYNKNK